MFKRFFSVCAVLVVGLSAACRHSSNDTPVTPTIGTVATVQGVVRQSETFAPVAGVAVLIEGVRYVTGVDGTYEISQLAPGPTVLAAERQGYQRYSENVTLEGARTYNIYLSPSNLQNYDGNWRGTWTTGPKSGGLVMTTAADTVAQTMRVALDIGGNIVDDFDPPGETYIGTILGLTAHFSQKSPSFGNITADLNSNGQFNGQATQVPIGDVSRFAFNGVINSLTINVNYTITFTNGTVQFGLATMSRN